MLYSSWIASFSGNAFSWMAHNAPDMQIHGHGSDGTNLFLRDFHLSLSKSVNRFDFAFEIELWGSAFYDESDGFVFRVPVSLSEISFGTSLATLHRTYAAARHFQYACRVWTVGPSFSDCPLLLDCRGHVGKERRFVTVTDGNPSWYKVNVSRSPILQNACDQLGRLQTFCESPNVPLALQAP